MSYEKRTETINTVETDVVRFYYVTDDVFNAVSEATSFKAASVIKEKDGQPDFDRIQISADEKNFMKKYLREAMLEIFATMFKIIAGETVVHDTEFLPTGGASGTDEVVASYADIIDNEKYRVINLALIDQLISNAINDFIMYKWYALKGLGGDAEIHMAEFRNGLARIVEKTLALRQPK